MSAGLDAMNTYLTNLPSGLASYPACTMKGSVLRSFLDGLPVAGGFEGLPEPLRTLVRERPLPGAWISEVQASALFAFAAAEYFPSGPKYEQHTHDANYALLNSLTYRVLFRLVGVTRLIDQAAARWGHFHRGTRLTVVERPTDRRATLALRSPPNHVPAALAQAYRAAFIAALEIAGEREVTVESVVVDAETLHFWVRWA